MPVHLLMGLYVYIYKVAYYVGDTMEPVNTDSGEADTCI